MFSQPPYVCVTLTHDEAKEGSRPHTGPASSVKAYCGLPQGITNTDTTPGLCGIEGQLPPVPEEEELLLPLKLLESPRCRRIESSPASQAQHRWTDDQILDVGGGHCEDRTLLHYNAC